MLPWIKDVKSPVQLVAFALVVLFIYLAKTKRNDEHRWIFPVALSAAVITLVGGLWLSYLQIAKPAPASISVAPKVAPQDVQPPLDQQPHTSSPADSPVHKPKKHRIQSPQTAVAPAPAQSTLPSAKDCPPDTAFCDVGEGGEWLGNISTGFSRGAVNEGKDTKFEGNLVVRERPEGYAKSPAKIEEYISIMEERQNKMWTGLPPAQLQIKLNQRAALEGQIRAVENDPKAVAPLLVRLATEFLLPN